MKLLDRYVLKEMISPFLISVCAFIWMFVGDMLFQNIKLILERQVPFILVLKVLALKIPWALGYAIPVAILFSTALAVNRLARDTEITAIRMSGTPVMRIFLPILFVGLCTSLLTYWIGEKVTPRAEREFRKTMWLIIGLNSAPTIQENVYFTSQGYHFYVEKVDRSIPKQVKLKNVLIYETPALHNYPMLITAKSATNQNNVWTLTDGVTHKLGADGLTEYELKFGEMTLDLKQAMQDLWDTQKTSEEMSAKELQKQISIFGAGGQEVTRMSVDWHLKLSIPLACLVFALCAAPLSLRFAKFGGYSGLFLSIIIMFLYRINQVWGQILGLSGKLPPFLAGWSQNIIFALIGLYLIWREE
ncbi:MAG TPA: LptF/LptG family permease [Armatimonadota bacterium]|jgi:lipopolysaccharide export system permease protein